MIEYRINERFSEKLLRSYEPNTWIPDSYDTKVLDENFNFSYFDIKIDGKRYYKETDEFIEIYNKAKFWSKLKQ